MGQTEERTKKIFHDLYLVFLVKDEVFYLERIDLTGKKFGHITITEMLYGHKATNNSKPKTFCKGICDCGNEVLVQRDNLKRGTPSCWVCAHKKTGEARRKEYVGKKFGSLTVYDVIYGYKINENSRPRTFCKCTCDCGNDVFINVDELTKENVSCLECSIKRRGKLFETDERGQKFGRLTIIDIDRSEKHSVAICKCDCGNIVRINKADVVAGHTLSCGCLHKERVTETNEKDYTGYISISGVKILDKSHKNGHGTWVYNCVCPECGNIFQALPCNVISGHKTSCGCSTKSSGERVISTILKENNIDFIPQKRFSDCRNIHTLPFDFAIMNGNSVERIIEYDGKQHEKPVEFFGGLESFLNLKRNDEIKNNYCKEKNIPLLRLTYRDTDQEIRNKILSFCNP